MDEKPVPRADDEPIDEHPNDPDRRQGCSAWWILVFLTVIFCVWFALTRWWDGQLERPKSSQAQSIAVTIINAIDQFHTDYDILPRPASALTGQDWNTDSSAEEGLILILKGEDETANAQKTDYLGDVRDAKTPEGVKRAGGLVRSADAIAIVDPWGRPFLIRLDGNGDGYIDDPSDEDSTPPRRLKKHAIAWSAGKDGDPATWKDNVASWTAGF